VQRWARRGAWGYALFFAAGVTSTLLGRSILATIEPGWWWLAAPGLPFALSAAAGLRGVGLRDVD